MSTLYILIGVPGCGKSTYAHTISNAIVISTDQIRKEILGTEENQSQGAMIFQEAFRRVRYNLSIGNNVVFDATNITRRNRKKILNIPADKYIGVYFNIPIEICKEQNAARNRVVPENVIDNMYSRLEEPALDEGFNDIIIIT